jgi:4-diphosphocytidyl-2-C-methyl-D-erythritol kinase
VIGRIKEKMYEHGAAYASMSGSGASVFGIFERFIDLKKEFSGWDYWSGELK